LQTSRYTGAIVNEKSVTGYFFQFPAKSPLGAKSFQQSAVSIQLAVIKAKLCPFMKNLLLIADG